MRKKSILYAESWNVCYRLKKNGSLLDGNKDVFWVVKNTARGWFADPFLFEYNNETYIFAEMYDYVLCRGTIAYAKITPKGVTKWRQVIKESYHLSYPFIFRYNQDIYIIPESSECNELYVYKAVQFPEKWKKVEVIRKNVKFVDTTFFKDGKALTYDISDKERYVLKCIDIHNPSNDETIGTQNILLSRPAGSFVSYEGHYYRPAQVCENDYGEALLFYKCEEIDKKYKEIPIFRVEPKQIVFNRKTRPLTGMHTYNATNKYEVIDIKTTRFNVVDLFFRIINKIKQKLKN